MLLSDICVGGLIWLEITLYPGKNKEQLDYCIFFLESSSIKYKADKCFLGNRVLIFSSDKIVKALASHICDFIFEFYLKEAVISKIYDEYHMFNTDDAGHILSEVSKKITCTPIKDDVLYIIKNKCKFNVESYFLFNIKPIMRCVYALTDETGRELIFLREKEKFVSMIKTFSNLSFEKCNVADVEFSSEDKCMVSFDKSPYGDVLSGELLDVLAQKSPNNVNIKNGVLQPELTDIIECVFNSKKTDNP